MDELKAILHKILHVAAGEDGQQVLHDEIDALEAPAPDAAPEAPEAPEAAPEAGTASEDSGAAEGFPAAPEPFGSESAPEAADAQ